MLTSGIYFCVKLGLLQLYPAYITFKALKQENQKEFSSLLTFWIVSISYLSVEYFSDIFLFWFPFYTEIKLALVLWLILPQTQGASVFYTHYLKPLLQANEHTIDNKLLELQARLKETVVLYGKRLIESVKQMISDTVFKGQETTDAQVTNELPIAPIQETGGIINPFSLFSTFISVKNVPAPIETVAVAAAAASPTTTTTTTAVVEKLDRTDSHDSLQSYVNIKSTETSPRPTWGNYLSSFVWKPPTTTTTATEQDKKQD
ncbi:TB2/DP1, HVA22 family-domain-containing protein [Helicostylum pulchrum]|nr:TB2/DP1, HVA22 family-domain-containing protein [Helicostylum pulchrum]